jgi:curved DNA-binding protein CbpA
VYDGVLQVADFRASDWLQFRAMDTSGIDPYAVLGIRRDASPLQVARAHRRLAKRFHPDRGPEGDPEKMRLVNEAWQILSIPIRRSSFDREHPSAGLPTAGHWAASRHPIQPLQPVTTRSWASWRMTAAETLSAPRTGITGQGSATVYRRPMSASAGPRSFRDSPWAAIAVAALMVILLVAAVALNRLG